MTTQKIMLNVCIALLPACAAGTWIFGLRAALVLLTCVVSCVMFEYLARILMKKEQTISDLSAVVTGLLLGMNLPSTLPLWMCMLGSFVAIVIVKQLFGGLGQNFANPAIVARIVLMLSCGGAMVNWIRPFSYQLMGGDTITSATPLVQSWYEYSADGVSQLIAPYALHELFIGARGGCLGETCALALIIGGFYLVVLKIISPAAPLSFILTVGLATLIYTGSFTVALYQVLTGGLLLGAIFMATDYATTPITTKGKIIFGIGCGIITFLIRQFGSFPEGVSFSILLMNILTPYIDRLTATKPLGAKLPEKKKKEAEVNG